MNKKLILLLVVLVVIGIGASALYLFNKAPESVVDKAPDISVDANIILSEYEEDEASANTKYLDKIVEVTGTVKEVIEKENEFIVLLGNEDSLGAVSCTLGIDQKSIAYGLKSGDNVTVKGVCTGYLIDVIMVDCHVV